MTSTPCVSCASACSLPAFTSSQFPMYDVTILIDGFAECAPRSNALKLSTTGGNSCPPMTPILLDLVIDAARMPARYEASAKPNVMPARFGPDVEPDVVT